MTKLVLRTSIKYIIKLFNKVIIKVIYKRREQSWKEK